MPRNTTLTARSPEDLLALVPLVLGFVPHESVVMLTFDARRTFHARVDLPAGEAEIADVVRSLLEPARRHRVRRVVFVLYAADERAARAVARPLVRAFESADMEVIEVLRADGDHWFTVLGRRPGVPGSGVPYDVSAHPFVAEAILHGHVTHGSREELADSLRPDPGRVARVAAALAVWSGRESEGRTARTAEEMEWARRLVSAHTAAGTTPTDTELARLLAGMRDPLVRDSAWVVMGRENAREQVGLWTDVVRRSPVEVLAAPAALLGFAAWLSGQGALAWCAIDRCRESAPDYEPAGVLADLLVHAVPPSTWEEGDEADDPP